MYNICAYLGQILLIPGHYVALSSAKIASIGGLDLYPYQIAQLGKNLKHTFAKQQNNFTPCSPLLCLLHHTVL